MLISLFFPVQGTQADDLEEQFRNPPAAARPWVFWYWDKGCVSAGGITADLEAMRGAGIGGAYLMTIKGPATPSAYVPAVEQLSLEWWALVRHAFVEADRLGLKLAMHACDGFAVAGGPWITPELSMQKLVWSRTDIAGGQHVAVDLPQPETLEGYYRDVAVLAYPAPPTDVGGSWTGITPSVVTSIADLDAQFLAEHDSEERLRLDAPGWIQFVYEQPFTCRSITILPDGNNFQANRLLVSVSDDGQNFREICRLVPPRHGWQNGTGEVTHAIPATTARYFRFTYDPAGSEPGAEDLDSAKWRPVLKVRRVTLSGEPRIHQYRSKNGSVWRESPRTTPQQIPDAECVPLDKVIDLTDKMTAGGRIEWVAPPGQWTVLRFGHTSTGARNATGGGGQGLECDKFSPEAARLQFDHWFGEAIRQVGPELARRVLTGFHVDSWECGSQNWSRDFLEEFQQRRGYSLRPYLPVMAGVPVTSADVSERVLFDVRQTIAELLNDNFFAPLAKLAHAEGCQFSAECVAPTMVSDGLRHFGTVDIPMGEFWLRSPTHDKPNDMLDAISGAHIYGKPIVQAEAYTELRMAWDEHPGNLKALGDFQYCQGINRLVYHVFNHNPWLNREPGMTLDAIGLFAQRNQTWWPAARSWVAYHHRCQALLQAGVPVVDIAVFTGEDVPSRAVLPERLIDTLPGLIGEEAIERQRNRLANEGLPLRELPHGVTHSANITDPAQWCDPLHGYKYDSLNRDALLRLAKVEGNSIALPNGPRYRVVVLPTARPLAPNPEVMTPEVAKHLGELVQAGGTVMATVHGRRSPSLTNYPASDAELLATLGEPPPEVTLLRKPVGTIQPVGAGRLYYGPFQEQHLGSLGIEPDFIAVADSGKRLHDVAWTHRRSEEADWYFVSNQQEAPRQMTLSLRVTGMVPELWDPLTGECQIAKCWQTSDKRTQVPVQLAANGSLFVVFRKATTDSGSNNGDNWPQVRIADTLWSAWKVEFDPQRGGPAEQVVFPQLIDWTEHPLQAVRDYSGTAVYRQTFTAKKPQERVWLDLGEVADLAEVTVNGVSCGVIWTPPYQVDITAALRGGKNKLEIAVTNTWRNRLLADQRLPAEERITWTTAPPLPEDFEALPAGLLGPVTLVEEVPPVTQAKMRTNEK